MRKYLTMMMAVGALVAAALSVGGASAETVKVGNLELNVDGGFSPKTLPKNKLAPIALTAEGHIRTLDGTHPPALKEVVLYTDKNGAIDVKGYPTCKSGQLQSRDTDDAMQACKPALVGTGTTTAEVEFNDQKAIDVDSKLLVFNGGVSGGKTTLYIHAYFSAPVSGAIVTTVKITSVKKGRYGIKSVATIPKIAGGAGSVTDFKLKIDKKFTYKGKKVSVLTAKCPDGKLQAEATGVFSDGTKMTTGFLRPCTGKG